MAGSSSSVVRLRGSVRAATGSPVPFAREGEEGRGGSQYRRLAVLSLLLLATSCASAEDLFVSGRLRDTCNESWPVCTTVAGCMVGDTSYLEGKFPGTRRFIVKTDGQKEISVVLFFKNEGAIGSETRIVWNEAGCGASSIEVIEGKSLFKEAAADGTLKRSRNVYIEGDHLIEITSDATVDYLLKIETRAPSAK